MSRSAGSAVGRPQRLNRAGSPLPAAPVRIVHLGLGAFHRSHQAAYTHAADQQNQWGIAAFTGRRPDAALRLRQQDGLYTLLERSERGERATVVASIVEAVNGSDVSRLVAVVASPSTALITMTITEAGYMLRSDGSLDRDNALIAQDIDRLRRGTLPPGASLSTVPARLAHALRARQAAGGAPIAVVPCDNLADNAARTRTALLEVAGAVDDRLASWIEQSVSVVGTSVDRITPRTTPRDVADVEAEYGYRDACPVVCEPFSDWILSGDFPAGRPAWEAVGARIVSDIAPFEARKLWLLNGAHSLLAYLGRARGHRTVADAMADPRCRRAVDALWELAGQHLHGSGLDLPGYRARLVRRFADARIRHELDQIAADGTTKLRARLVPLVNHACRAGGNAQPALLVIAAWMEHLDAIGQITTDVDACAEAVRPAVQRRGRDQTRALLGLLDPRWPEHSDLVGRVHELRRELSDGPRPPLSASGRTPVASERLSS